MRLGGEAGQSVKDTTVSGDRILNPKMEALGSSKTELFRQVTLF
jgi:hypothetical protein